MKLYRELAGWWPLFSEPLHYASEAEFIHKVLDDFGNGPRQRVLELGSGGGNNAFHLSAHYSLTLVDVSPQMLGVSRKLNPLCEHIEGDMRTVRLGRAFDAVFIHDAICYLTSEQDLHAAMRTAFEHCRVGGTALFMPDFVCETFVAETKHGGYDSGVRGLRYLDWTYDPDPDDTTYIVDLVIAMREANSEVRVVHDRHIQGLFAPSRLATPAQRDRLRGAGYCRSLAARSICCQTPCLRQPSTQEKVDGSDQETHRDRPDSFCFELDCLNDLSSR